MTTGEQSHDDGSKAELPQTKIKHYKSEREEQRAGRQLKSAEKKRSISNGCFNAAGPFFRRLAIEKGAIEYQRR